MTARSLVQFIATPASELPSLKRRVLRRVLDVVLIGMVTLLSLFSGTVLSAIFLSGVE
jgi:hypothetical protein